MFGHQFTTACIRYVGRKVVTRYIKRERQARKVEYLNQFTSRPPTMSSKKDKKSSKTKSPAKEKAVEKEEKMEVETEEVEDSKSSAKYAAKAKHVTVIAKPLASRKTTSKLYSLTKKGMVMMIGPI